MKIYLAFACLLGCVSPAQAFLLHHNHGGGGGGALSQVSEEEFVGPFASWACVTSLASGKCGAAAAAYGTAVGDGSTDDTAAIQTMLNALAAGSTSYQVLWFPASTYKITHTLSLSPAGIALHLGLIGAAPGTNCAAGQTADTCVLWAGGSASTTVASFTGAIATTGSGASQVITLTASSVTGTIIPGDVMSCPGCSPVLTTPTLIWKQLTGTAGAAGTYQLTNNAGTSATQSATAMTTADRSMLWLNGTAYSRLDRMTFNGQSNATILVDQSCAAENGGGSCATPNFDAGNEYIDDVFENGGYGHYCGSLNSGCADMYDVRDTFSNLTNAGIWMGNFNALDMFVWYGAFLNNAVGISNNAGAGNWRVFNSIFNGSSVTDVACGNPGLFTMRGNYSVGSNYFWQCGGSSSGNHVTIQGNTILDNTLLSASNGDGTVTEGANFPSIRQADLGPLLLIDNTIRSIASPATPIATSKGGLFSLGNTFTASPSETFNTGGLGFPGHSINDQVVSRSTVLPTCISPTWTCLPVLPPTPPNLGRTIFETSPTGSGTTCSVASPCTIAAAITKAAVLCNNAVVHILPVNYNISSTLVVPGNCAMQIIGDGGMIGVGSELSWNGANGGTVLQLTGPSKATLTQFQINGNSGNATAILVTNADQPGSRIYALDTNLSSAPTNLLVNQLDYTRVELENFVHSQSSSTTIGSVNVIGGASANAGSWLGGVTAQYAGGFGADGINFTASNGAHLLADSLWIENYSPHAPGTPLSLSGNSVVTYSGANSAQWNGPAVSLVGFQGTAAILALQISGANCSGGTSCLNVNLSGNGSGGQVLALGLDAFSTSTGAFFNDTTSPADTSEYLNSSWICGGVFPPDINPPCPNPGTGVGLIPITEIPASNPSTPFILATLNQMRTTAPVQRTPTLAGVTDVGIYGVFVSNALIGIDLEH